MLEFTQQGSRDIDCVSAVNIRTANTIKCDLYYALFGHGGTGNEIAIHYNIGSAAVRSHR